MSENDHPSGPSDRPTRQAPGPTAEGCSARTRRVLLVSSDLAWIDRATGLLDAAGVQCVCAGTLRVARERCGSWFDAAVVDVALADGDGLALAAALASIGTPVVMAAPEASLDLAAAAAGAGARDLIGRDVTGRRLIERILGVVTAPRCAGRDRAPWASGRRALGRLSGLRRAAGAGAAGRDGAAGKGRRDRVDDGRVAAGTDGPAVRRGSAPPGDPESAEPMNQVTIANEFGGLIRFELDIESLLRTTLEFVLAKCGPTNAAVFLPTTSGDYSLGAYVNYDCPKETVDVLLDHLANAVAPRFQDQRGIAHFADARSLEAAFGDDAGWIDGSGVVVFTCRHDDETLAICMLFRDRRTPYAPPLLQQLSTIGDLFAAQLARVIRIHHRHLPRDKWGALGDTGHDEDESDGFGGGLAA